MATKFQVRLTNAGDTYWFQVVGGAGAATPADPASVSGSETGGVTPTTPTEGTTVFFKFNGNGLVGDPFISPL